MNIVITMAGEGSRFKKAGFNDPKYRITVRGRTLFEWALLSLKSFFNERFIFVVKEVDHASAFIKDQCKKLGINNFTVQQLTSLTEGQAATAYAAKSEISNTQEPILIYNIDTHIDSEAIKPSQIEGDGWIPCFKCLGDHWSFVSFDSKKQVNKVTEKVRISEFGSIGLYYFNSFDLFEKCYGGFQYEGYRERYVAPLYTLLLDAPSKRVTTFVINESEVYPLGTPEEVRQFEAGAHHHSIGT